MKKVKTEKTVSFRKALIKDIKKNKFKYIMVLPILIYLLIFAYKPMYGLLIAFKDYRVTISVGDAEWVGLKFFKQFFSDPYCFRLFRNTLIINLLGLLITFTMPIIFALLLNEVRIKWFKKSVQTISYMPHFVSMVIVCGMITNFCSTDGIITNLLSVFGVEKDNLLLNKDYFYTIYIVSDVWKSIGWNSIIFLAALSSIDQEQYEAARIDGASRLQQMRYITFPGLLPTISMLLILRIGQLLTIGYEKIMLLYQPTTYEVADVISTYVYRKGIYSGNFSYGTAVGLFNSVMNIVLLIIANKMSKKMGQSGLF